MANDREIEDQFWGALEDSPFVMLGLAEARGSAMQPMTARFDDEDRERGCVWFFSAKDHDLTRALGEQDRAVASFAAKGHDLFASLQGELVRDDDRAVIERLWNPFVAAWYEGGKDDPSLALLRLDAEHAEIWRNASSLVAGAKLLLGADPKREYKDNVAHVNLQ